MSYLRTIMWKRWIAANTNVSMGMSFIWIHSCYYSIFSLEKLQAKRSSVQLYGLRYIFCLEATWYNMPYDWKVFNPRTEHQSELYCNRKAEKDLLHFYGGLSTHTSFGVSYLCHASVIPTVSFYNFLEIARIIMSMSIIPRLHPMVGVFKYFLTTKHLLHRKSSTIETN